MHMPDRPAFWVVRNGGQCTCNATCQQNDKLIFLSKLSMQTLILFIHPFTFQIHILSHIFPQIKLLLKIIIVYFIAIYLLDQMMPSPIYYQRDRGRFLQSYSIESFIQFIQIKLNNTILIVLLTFKLISEIKI